MQLHLCRLNFTILLVIYDDAIGKVGKSLKRPEPEAKKTLLVTAFSLTELILNRSHRSCYRKRAQSHHCTVIPGWERRRGLKIKARFSIATHLAVKVDHNPLWNYK